jgi:integrase/recombinase XerD
MPVVLSAPNTGLRQPHEQTAWTPPSPFAEPLGAPLRYQAVQALVSRLRERTGIEFSCHTLRHSHATDLIRRGVPIEVVSKRLTHASVTTTSAAYVHLQADDVRAELIRAGVWWPGPGEQA